MSIEIYHDYTPLRLKNELIGINVGDTDELHNAVIVLCGIVAQLEKRISALEADKPSDEHQEYLEKRKDWAERVENNRRIAEGR